MMTSENLLLAEVFDNIFTVIDIILASMKAGVKNWSLEAFKNAVVWAKHIEQVICVLYFRYLYSQASFILAYYSFYKNLGTCL